VTEVLIVAATRLELCGRDGLVCGVGPVEAAATTASRLALGGGDAVLHVGIAGARPGAELARGDLVVGTEAHYEDLAAGQKLAPSLTLPDAALVEAVKALGVDPVPIGTSARVGGVARCVVEAMEGFAVLRAAELAGVPAVEVRAISNFLGDSRSEWRVDDALEALGHALLQLVDAVAAAL